MDVYLAQYQKENNDFYSLTIFWSKPFLSGIITFTTLNRSISSQHLSLSSWLGLIRAAAAQTEPGRSEFYYEVKIKDFITYILWSNYKTQHILISCTNIIYRVFIYLILSCWPLIMVRATVRFIVTRIRLIPIFSTGLFRLLTIGIRFLNKGLEVWLL